MRLSGKEVALTTVEFDLLALAQHPNRVLSRDQLLALTREAGPFDRSIDAQGPQNGP